MYCSVFDSRCNNCLNRMVLLAFIVVVSAPVSRAATQSNPHARDLMLLAQWYTGQFDNEEQLWFERDPRSQIPEAQRHERIHVAHTRLHLPAFGEHVFYVEEYKDNNPEDLIRQRFVVFSAESGAKSIRMRQGFFKEAAQFGGGANDPELFADLKSEQVFFLDECDVYWQRVGSQFHGKMKPEACVFGEGEKRRYSVHNLILSADQYWRVDSTFLVSDDSLHVGHPVDQPYRLRRAKSFICDVVFRDDGGGAEEVKGVPLHSQGGTADVTRESDGAVFTLLMRDKEYPYYETRPDFIYFSVREKGQPRSIVYSVNDTRSRRLGVSVGWLNAHCYLKGYTFGETYDQLQILE